MLSPQRKVSTEDNSLVERYYLPTTIPPWEMMKSDACTAKLIVAPTVPAIGGVLSELIIESCCKPALHTRGVFTIALSGGSLPSFLQELPSYCQRAGVNPQWENWHVLLADERCVVSTDSESNLASVQSNFTNFVRSMLILLPTDY
jgi:hypothetical protein